MKELPEFIGTVRVRDPDPAPKKPAVTAPPPEPAEGGTTPAAESPIQAVPPSSPATSPVPEPLPMEEIPMDLYEAEAKALFGDVPPIKAPDLPPAEPAPIEIPVPQAAEPTPVLSPEAGETSPASKEPYRMVGEVFHSYVIVEQGDRMLLIDKHAAHERLIFEQLKANMKGRSVDAQLLMLPIEIMLMSEEVGLLDTYRAELEAVGFSYVCQRFTVRVDSIPSGIEAAAVPDMLAAIAEGLKDGVDTAKLTRDVIFEKALYQASCKAAIKAGRDYPSEHIAWLVDELMKLPDITFCPHGRPVAMEMKKRNIDHQFERC